VSSIIQPILKLQQGEKIVKVSISLGNGVKNGTTAVTGLVSVDQILSEYLTGAGLTAATGFATDAFIIPPNTVGVSIVGGGAATNTAYLLVQGY